MRTNHVRILTQVSMLIAIQFILSKFCSISTDSIRIGFGFIPMALCGMLYGPIWAAIAYSVADILGGALVYGSVNPFITLAVAITGFGYGLFLHRDSVRFFPNVVGAVAVSLVCSMLLTTFILSAMYGSPFTAMFIMRIPQGLGIIVSESLIIPIIYNFSRSLTKHGLAATA